MSVGKKYFNVLWVKTWLGFLSTSFIYLNHIFYKTSFWNKVHISQINIVYLKYYVLYGFYFTFYLKKNLKNWSYTFVYF